MKTVNIEKCFGETSNDNGRAVAEIAHAIINMYAPLHLGEKTAFEYGGCLGYLVAEEIVNRLMDIHGENYKTIALNIPHFTITAMRALRGSDIDLDCENSSRMQLRKLFSEI